MASSKTRFEQEGQLEALFADLKGGFQKLETMTSATKQQTLLKDLKGKMQESKTLIKDFEREARMESMPVNELTARKKVLVQELNAHIAAKKAFEEAVQSKAELVGTGRSNKDDTARGNDGKSAVELMALGRKQIGETDQALTRAQKVVASTIEVGTKIAETMEGQTKQMERVLDDLEEIRFTMKKASQVIRDMTRGMATDRCIRAMLFIVIVGCVVLIALKSAGIGGKALGIPTPKFQTNLQAAVGGRRLLLWAR